MNPPAASEGDRRSIDLAFWPFYTGNPYQRLFYGADTDLFRARPILDKQPGNIEDWCGPPAPHRIPCFHLHWLNSAIRINDSAAEASRAASELLNGLGQLKRRGVILAWTVHNLISHDTPHQRIESALAREVAELADLVLLHGSATIDEVREALPALRGKEIIVPHGNYIGAYGDSISREAARRPLGIGPETTIFLCLGHVRPYKGIVTFAHAFGALAHEAGRAHLIVAGRPSGVTAEEIQSAAAASGVGLTCDLRTIPDDEMAHFLGAADWMALPYRAVLTSGSALLGMSFGVPILAPALGLLPELLDDGRDALLFDPSAPAALENALRRALAVAPADRDRMGQAALAKARRQDWTEGRERFIRAIRQAASQREIS